jgi:hypothetical protein
MIPETFSGKGMQVFSMAEFFAYIVEIFGAKRRLIQSRYHFEKRERGPLGAILAPLKGQVINAFLRLVMGLIQVSLFQISHPALASMIYEWQPLDG